MNNDININKFHRYSLGLIVFIVALVIYTAIHPLTIFIDCDSPWHIAAGDHIRATGKVPFSDPWSFTAGDFRWYNLTWLFDVWVSWLHSTIGLRGLVAENLMAAALIPFTLVWLCLQRGSSLVATLMTCVFALLVLALGVSVRGQQMGLLIIALTLAVLCSYRQRETKWIWLLPVIMLFWANVHGSFLVHFIMIGSFFLEALFARDTRRVKTYVLVGFACILTSLLNPIGYHIYIGSWMSLGSEIAQSSISEWKAAKYSESPHIYIYFVLILVLQFKVRLKVPLADVLLMTFWMAMAFNTIRHSMIMVMFTTPILAMLLSNAFETNTGRLNKIESTMRVDFAKPKMAKQFALITAVIIAVYTVPFTRNIIISDNLYNPEKYPVAEIDYLKEHHPRSNIFAEYCHAGKIIYQARDKLRPMLDSRITTAFPDDVVKDYLDMHSFKPDWPEIANKYDFELAMFPNDMDKAVNAFKAEKWDIVHKGPVATIYRKPKAETSTQVSQE